LFWSNPHKHDDEIIIPHAAPIFVDHKNITAVSVLNFDEANFRKVIATIRLP
jgi:hypothetical protein